MNFFFDLVIGGLSIGACYALVALAMVIIYKTSEVPNFAQGEMAMISLPGVMPEIFRFTVRDDAVAASVNQTLGQKVALKYEQHIGLPTTCWGETDHFVVSVRPAGQ